MKTPSMRNLLRSLCLLLPVMTLTVATASAQSGKVSLPPTAVLYADYSDPDVIRVGDDYWMTASSFQCVPGLPILHSTDLVNWKIVNYALDQLTPAEVFDQPNHGGGVWAPCIRFHEGWFYIYWGDPDYGIYMVKTQDPTQKWSLPVCVCVGKGMIDTSPFWDEDGKAYLVHGWAGSRAGFKSVLSIAPMAPDGTSLIGPEVLVFDGHEDHPTVEGPKMYKRNGWYYIFAPAGGVKPGWQLVMRSKNVYGPYEERKVLEQGTSAVNGPHQGAWIDDPQGNDWFIHFQDVYAYGRIVHLQPLTWSSDDWCVIGEDPENDGIGIPASKLFKPTVTNAVSRTFEKSCDAANGSDSFTTPYLGLQWQWHANPQRHWYFLHPSDGGYIRLNCKYTQASTLWTVPNLLLQKFTSREFTATAKVNAQLSYDGDRSGLVVMGIDYATLDVCLEDGQYYLVQAVCINAENGGAEVIESKTPLDNGSVYLRTQVKYEASTGRPLCTFFYSTDGKKYKSVGVPFYAKEGKWIGAKVGLFAIASQQKNDGGRMDVEEFEVK